MSPWIPSVQWRMVAGNPINTANGNVILISRALLVRFPFGGLVWNKPVAIKFEHKGQVQHLPVIDVTRLAIISIAGIGMAISAMATLLAFSKKQRNKSQT